MSALTDPNQVDYSKFGFERSPESDNQNNARPLERSPYESELNFFKSNPHVSGMATEDEKVILNPHSNLTPEHAQSVYQNELARLHLRKKTNKPQFALTEKQKEFFKDYPSKNPQDIRDTIIGRIISGDPSAQDVTDEQRKYANSIKEEMQPNKIDYSQFGFEPEKKKAGKGESIWLGIQEGALSLPALAQYGINEWSRSLEKAFSNEKDEEKKQEPSFEKENPLLSYISKFPESEDQTARRLRIGATAVTAGAPFGIPGIIAGLVGSQAGQTIREVWGKEGKFEKFGAGEAAALGTDLLTGGAAAIGTNLAKGATRAATSQVPSIFQNAQTGLQRSVTRNAIQGEKNALQDIINNFSTSQVRGFETEASQLSPNRFTDLTQSSASGLQRNADNLFREGQLSIISPLAATPEQGGSAIQEAANTVFRENVIGAERQAYRAAEEAAEGLTGAAPRTVEQARALRASLTATVATPEQQAVIHFLDNLIGELETTTPASTRAASTLINEHGQPLIPATTTPASQEATRRSATDLISTIQNANQAVNYGSELRLQSHRLIPIVNTLRQEVGQVLARRPQAANLYQAANALHGENAETWGTRYMRNVRFTENPESIVGQTKSASNMRNLKQAIPSPALQSLGERLVIDNITQGGSSKANRLALNNLAPELSLNARNAGQALSNIKDPLTEAGGRAAIRNSILTDAAQAVNTGKRPEKILSLMQTPKGYEIVRESLSHSHQGRELFRTFERLFVEDIFSSITDSTGQINFKAAQSIFKNQDVRAVVQRINPLLERQFTQLEQYASNFERNLSLYKSPETKSVFQKLVTNTRNAGLLGIVMHALHVPIEVIAALGLGGAVVGAVKIGSRAAVDKILSNPNAVRMLESISKASTAAELAKQVPRLLAEIDKTNESD